MLMVIDEESEDKMVKEIKVTKGDFMGFPAGRKLAHGLKSGSGDLVYIVGGSREPLDVSNYPEAQRRRVIARDTTYWAVDEVNVIPQDN